MLPIEPGQGPNPHDPAAPPGGKVLKLGTLFVRTLRHFFPQLNAWLDEVPDTRFQPFVEYHRRFLLWLAMLVFALRLGSRRQIDFDLRDLELCLLANLNRLAGTDQQSLPVTNTVDHFLEHCQGPEPLATLRQQCAHRLIRMRALDPFRLLGRLVVAVDGTGMLTFHQRHCEHCLTQKHGDTVVYFHPVLEAKIVTSAGLAISLESEFIENAPHDAEVHYDRLKQDCELKAFARLAERFAGAFPQLQIIWSADSLYACGAFFARCRRAGWSFVVTFKAGRLPELWREFQALLPLQPGQALREELPDHTVRLYRWVEHLSYADSEQRAHTLNALLCEETAPTGQVTTFAWLTDLPLNRQTVVAVAGQGGRIRSIIENEGFNVQKNSGLNLEHAYSLDWAKAKAYYYLLQLGHLFFQLLEKGSLLRALAIEYGKTTVVQVWGGQEKLAQRLLDALRYYLLPTESAQTSSCRVSFGLDTS